MKEFEWNLKDLEDVPKNNYKVFSCFSCGGGSTMGYKLAGYDVPGYASDKDIMILQTFPQDYDFMGMNVQYICGMSVPPIMMKKIAEQVKIQLLDQIE